MIQFSGQIALILALVSAFLQGVLPLIGNWRGNPYLLACARPGAWAQFAFVTAAYVLLTVAFVSNDFSIAYVAANSHPLLPLMYRLTAVWGAHEGSILLWILILNVWTIAYAVLCPPLPDPLLQQKALEEREHEIPLSSSSSWRRGPGRGGNNYFLVLAVLGLISFSFLCFLLLTSNPFLPAAGPMQGLDLNPLLQDPGFVIHPPMLYMGYVGFSAAFAITQAALIRGQLDSAWARTTRRFAVAAWGFLTLGITLGSWWAYRVLGWGGFWFWDPVENASLLPWLSGTAYIHVLMLVEKRDTAKGWAALLALISFGLSLLGTFLVRSGVLISAHTFASDPTRGVFLLLLLAVLVTAALAIYVARLPRLAGKKGEPFHWLSREMSLLLNSALLMTAMLTVLLGTLYPLILDALHLGVISVGPPYFNKVMLPLVLVVMVFMGFAPLLRWQEQGMKELLLAAGKKILIAAAAALAVLWGVTGQLELMPALTLCLSFWIILSVTGSLRLLPGMSLAHAGFAMLVIGVILSGSLNEERQVRMKPGDGVNLGPYQFFFLDTQGTGGSNYRGIQASFEVVKNGRHVANLYPEKRIYTVREMVMTKVDIHPGVFRDLYIALGEPLDDNFWSVRLYYKPFVRWIWFGGIIMMLGGISTLLNRKGKTA